MQFVAVDIFILDKLKEGFTQIEVSKLLKEKGFKQNSVSFIEKRINRTKKVFKAKTIYQLAFILTSKGVI